MVHSRYDFLGVSVIAFTRKTDYALIALASLAQESPEGAPAPLSARAIATRYSVPLPILMNVLKDLTGAELVRSTRGVKGGYVLARPSRQITVHDVVEAIEGRPSLVMCCDATEVEPCEPCGVEFHCPVTHAVRRLNERVNLFLRQVTLADLLDGKPLAPPVVPLATLRQSIPRPDESAPTRRSS
ncbi:MAG: Rrf2 family transcriptional regulator [bacterium]